MPLSVKLYNTNLASPQLLADLTGEVNGLKFSTRLPGGFDVASFIIPATIIEVEEWLNRRLGCRLVVHDAKKVIWEGRLDGVKPRNGQATITAYGYFINCTDKPYSTAYNTNVGAIIKAMLTAQCSQISADQSHIATTGSTVDSAAGASYLDQPVSEIIKLLVPFSDASGNTYDFGVWDDRIPYLTARSLTAVDWVVNVADLQSFNPDYNMADFWPSAYAIYTSGGVLTRTATVTNQAAIDKRGGINRTYVIPNLGEVSAAAALNAAKVWVNEHKDIYPDFSSFGLGATITNSKGAPYPSYWVRAGQVIRIADLLPSSSQLSSVTRDALTTFFITETEYNVSESKLTLTVDRPSRKLTAQV